MPAIEASALLLTNPLIRAELVNCEFLRDWLKQQPQIWPSVSPGCHIQLCLPRWCSVLRDVVLAAPWISAHIQSLKDALRMVNNKLRSPGPSIFSH